MKKESPISVNKVKFCSFTFNEKKEIGKDLWKLTFDDRHDFPVDSAFAGIAAMVIIGNERINCERPRGVRRKVKLTLVNTTDRCEVASQNVGFYIPKDDYLYLAYADFSVRTADFQAGHAYKLVVQDLISSVMLGEYGFQLSGRGMSGPDSDADASDEEDEFEAALNRFIESCPGDDEAEDAKSAGGAGEKPGESSLMSPLDHLTGLASVKEKLLTYERVVRFNKMRADKKLPTSPAPLHAMFLGSPGTGKTTVAKMIGIMLRRAGVLSRGHVVVRERATLLGQYYNSEGEKTLAAIEEAQGGILFIDEAYQLYQPDDSRDPGKFIIETLLTALADESKRDWMLVLAGYPDAMKRMFDLNPGFKSRIPDSNIYTFDDFTEEELMKIAEKYLSCHQYTLSPDAHAALSDRLKFDYSHREKNFGNARHVINMIQTEILPAMAVRVTSKGTVDESDLTEIQSADIPQPVVSRVVSRPRIGFVA
ncbi:MAG: AAA family ATPase [Paraprevotella sp.]|nr:AAA family ATPase [Paraprevotella sp.]